METELNTGSRSGQMEREGVSLDNETLGFCLRSGGVGLGCAVS